MNIEQLYSLYLKHPKISIDSRNIEPDSIFFALKGAHFDGNIYAKSAIDAGAACAIVDAPNLNTVGWPYIAVENVLTTLQNLALWHRKKLNIPVIALTGSNGKTTTKELIYKILEKKYKTSATVGNLNNHIGVPLTILRTPQDSEILIIEMGANHQGEIAMLCNIALPDHVLITNIGKAHLEGFGGEEGVKKGKSEIYKYAQQHKKHIFINADDTILKELLPKNTTITAYSVHKMFETISSSPTLSLHFEDQHIHTNLYGQYNVQNIAAAITIGLYFDVEKSSIVNAISEYLPNNNRSEITKFGTNKIIKDAYNANPTSMKESIESFSTLPSPSKIAILGDMLELGDSTLQEHKNLIKIVKSHEFEKVIFIGKHFMNAKDPNFGQYFESIVEAKKHINIRNIHHSTILLKGSRGIGVEKILD